MIEKQSRLPMHANIRRLPNFQENHVNTNEYKFKFANTIKKSSDVKLYNR